MRKRLLKRLLLALLLVALTACALPLLAQQLSSAEFILSFCN